MYIQLGLGTLQDGSLPKPSWTSRNQNSMLVRFLGLRLWYMLSIRYSHKRRQRPFCWWTPAIRLTPLTVALLFTTSINCVRHLLQPSSTPTGHQLNYLLVICYILVKVPLKGSCYAHVRTYYDSPYHKARLSPW